MPEKAMNREELMCVLEDAISELSYKITEGRIVDADREKVRLKQYRVLTSMISEYRRNLQDEDLEELAEKVERLEALASNEQPVKIG
jgi:hypothetical protein